MRYTILRRKPNGKYQLVDRYVCMNIDEAREYYKVHYLHDEADGTEITISDGYNYLVMRAIRPDPPMSLANVMVDA